MLAEVLTIDVPHGGNGVPTAQDLFTEYPFIGVLLALMALDIITGWLAAGVTGKLSSKESTKGTMRKAMILAVVGTGYIMQFVVPVAWGPFLAICFIGTECLSIVENAGRCGVPVPRAFMEAMAKLRQQEAEESKPAAVKVVVNDAEAIKETVEPIVRQGVHDLRDDLNRTTLKVQEALSDSQIVKSKKPGN